MTTTGRIKKLGLTSLLTVSVVGAVALAVTASGCVIDPGSGYGGGCAPDLLIDWQIQNSAGAPVTCGGAGAATVTATVDGTPYQQTCPPNFAQGQFDVFLPYSGNTDVTVNLYDSTGTSLAPSQSITLNVTSCYTSETPSPALLVVSPPAP
jgi:hypothetical protein